MNVAIVIPTYNERNTIQELIAALHKQNPAYALIIVDDNSPDGTAQLVQDVMKTNKQVSLISRSTKDGRGGAVLAGISAALQYQRAFDRIVEMDGDLSHRPEDVQHMIACSRDVDMVIGSRYLTGSGIRNRTLLRRWFSRTANWYARLVLRIPISDYTNGLRVYSRAAAQTLISLRITMKGYIALSEIAYKLYKKGFRIVEVPTVFVNNERSASNTTLHEIVHAFAGILRIRFQDV